MAIEFKDPLPARAPKDGAGTAKKEKGWRASRTAMAAGPLLTFIMLLCTEWVHRGSLGAEFWGKYFIQHVPASLLAWGFLTCMYYLLYGLTRLAPAAILLTGCVGYIPAVITYFKLKLRGEPFLPWDIYQAKEAVQVVGKAGVEPQPFMYWAAGILLVLTVLFCFVRRPHWSGKQRAAAILLPAAGTLVMIFGIFLQPAVTRAMGIIPDMWMQDRYYQRHGVITGFLTNLTMLRIEEPEGYSEEKISELAQQIRDNESLTPRYENSYAAKGDGTVKQPHIIYVMDEAYWDVSRLPGVEYSEDISAGIHKLQQESAFGRSYSPSFGGGTCDVEFEALTGYSKEFLPLGSKPFQQHINREMASLPNFLKEQGYQTEAVHGFYRRFWNRDKAYPRLGIDEFRGKENMTNPECKRGVDWKGGLVTDNEMATQIIDMFEHRDPNKPLFLHAVTMQNHTRYHAENYPDSERVRVVQAPGGMSPETVGALEDFATGVRDASDMLIRLTEYFSQVDEPVILAFWGDHYNPIGNGMEVYTSTGYAGENNNDPEVHKTDLLIWSNYWKEPIELGTVGAYEITPVVMELYGLDKPLMFEYLDQQLDIYRARTLGTTVEPDDTDTVQEVSEMTDEQKRWFGDHWLLQYDLMFGKEYLLAQ